MKSSDGAVVAELADEPVSLARLLPDPDRWVVVKDWAARAANDQSAPTSGVLLDLAPVDEQGVPELGRRISVFYVAGPFEEFDRVWGDTSAMGEPIEFTIDDGVGRTVRSPDTDLAVAQVWSRGTHLYMQSQFGHTGVDLVDLARSLTVVDEAMWTAALASAEHQWLLAIEAAMADIEPIAGSDEPLPHWVLPAPWEPVWVTDKTIWTTEQRAQSAALSAATRPAGLPDQSDHRRWHVGFGESPNEASMRFVPQLSVGVLKIDESVRVPLASNDESIDALGLTGVISPFGPGRYTVSLGDSTLSVAVTSLGLDKERVREFLDTIEFATNEPFDGFLIGDPRFQQIDLGETVEQPPNWHAGWGHPGLPDASMSVWRLSVAELRVWLADRGEGMAAPDDIWEIVAEEGMVTLGRGVTYDVESGILMSLRGIAPDDLIPIGLQDWIELVAPVNTDPLNPR